jgi:iron complex transport system substrate-binding protein
MTNTNNLRIVSLLPSATEIVDCLGLTSMLVGRSHECDYPSAVKLLPACTAARLDSHKTSAEIDSQVAQLVQSALSIYEINLQVLEELQPTHIVTQDQCDVCAVSFADVVRAVGELTQSHPQIISLQPNTLGEVWQDIARVGEQLGVDAAPVIQSLQQRVTNCRYQTQGLANLPTVGAIEWTDPLMVAGNWNPELITIAGGINLFGSLGKHSPYLTWEELTIGDPDVLIIMPCGFDLQRTYQETSQLSQHPQWQNLKAVESQQVYITDGNAYFNRPGPRLVDSLEIVAEILHPRQFPPQYQGRGWEKFSPRVPKT